MRVRATLLLLGLITVPAAAEPAACWVPGALAHRAGEERVQKGVRLAHISPPRRELTSYSPLPQRGAVRRVKLRSGQKLVALTFDLCELPSEIAGYQGGHMDILSRIAIVFSDEDEVNTLLAAGSKQELYDLLNAVTEG